MCLSACGIALSEIRAEMRDPSFSYQIDVAHHRNFQAREYCE